MIVDSSYRRLAVVRAGNGYQPDLHEFQITPQGTALITVYDGIDCDLSAVGGPRDAAVADTLMQEIDLETGLVRYEWHSLDHVPLSDSYVSARHASRTKPFDYFHINSIDVQPDGDLLIDARNTWAAYDVDRAHRHRCAGGWAGKRCELRDGRRARATAYQHDARRAGRRHDHVLRQRRDAGGAPRSRARSSARWTLRAMTATLVREAVAPGQAARRRQPGQPAGAGRAATGWSGGARCPT